MALHPRRRTASASRATLRDRLTRRLAAVCVVLALGAIGSFAGLAAKARSTAPASTIALAAAPHDHAVDLGPSTAPVATPTPVATSAVLAPMRKRVDPDLFVTSPTSLSAAQVRALIRATGATRSLQVDYAQVALGPGVTTAVGVDPSTFRNFAPDNTAPVDALWRRIKAGDVAVAHAVGAAVQLRLGGYVTVGHDVEQTVRVGAFATTRLPGVGVVVDRSRSSELGLVRGAALIVVLPADTDPLAAAKAAQKVLDKGKRTNPKKDVGKVQALRYAAQTGLPAGGSSGPTVPGGVPVLGSGWTLPLRLGSFTLTQRFGGVTHHPGIDLGAPWGTPIYAAAEGDVLYWGPAQGFGNWIVLQHPGGIQTVYGHMRLDELLVKPNAHVRAGQLIARVGSEGESTGPHLHFEVHVDNQRVDPIAFLRAHGITALQ